jgi:FkbM family methyltransferase
LKRDFFTYWHRRWLLADGDASLRLDYPLNADSVVFDVGGFKGDFSAAILGKFNCNIFIFEPVRDFYGACATRFATDARVACFNFGLGDSDGDFGMINTGDASSICLGPSPCSDLVKVRRFETVFSELLITRIDLLKINIEGGEFPLLDHIIASGLILHVNHIQVQFHDFVPLAEHLRMNVRRLLSETHEEVWCFPFIWESWRIRSL